MGGAAESVTKYLAERYTSGLSRDEALKVAAAALGHNDAGHRDIPAKDLEVAVLDRTRTQERKFKRLNGEVLEQLLGAVPPTDPAPGDEERPPTAESTRRHPDEPPVAP